MSLVINHNLMAMNTARNLQVSYGRMGKSIERLSTGLRINSAADDAAGLAIRETMRKDIAAINQGIRNANDGISLIQTAEGALSVIDEKLIRMKELAEQSASGTYTNEQRMIIHSEFAAMASEIDRIASATDFNGIKLLNGNVSVSGVTGNEGSWSANNTWVATDSRISSSMWTNSSGWQESNGAAVNGDVIGGIKIHFGPDNNRAEDYYFIRIGDFRSNSMGVGSDDIAVSTQHAAQIALETLNTAIIRKENSRAALGAIQNRLENTITNLAIQAENLQASESRISDIDVASEMTEFTRNQILTQAAVGMLAQANSLPQMAMRLMG